MAELYRSKWTMGAIGALYGLSDDRVKDLLIVHMSAEDRRAIKLAEIADRAAERRSAKSLDELLRRCAEATPCVVCRGWVLRRRGTLTCSPECAKTWVVGRLQLDENEHEKHRRSQARTFLAKPEKYARYTEWAKRVLSDDPPPPNRRFVVPGSRAAAVVESIDR